MRWQGLVLIARALMFRIADAGKTIHSILLKRSPPTNTFIASKGADCSAAYRPWR